VTHIEHHEGTASEVRTVTDEEDLERLHLYARIAEAQARQSEGHASKAASETAAQAAQIEAQFRAEALADARELREAVAQVWRDHRDHAESRRRQFDAAWAARQTPTVPAPRSPHQKGIASWPVQE
jgi:hypothetical protein